MIPTPIESSPGVYNYSYNAGAGLMTIRVLTDMPTPRVAIWINLSDGSSLPAPFFWDELVHIIHDALARKQLRNQGLQSSN